MRASTLVAATALLVASSAVADEASVTTGQEIDLSFAVVKARLTDQGFDHPRMIGRSPTHLYATSAEGTPVVVRLDPQTGDVLSVGAVQGAAE
ncbi:MAG: hypothetical protein RID91_12480 [Azospirillaceae bacterium]